MKTMVFNLLVLIGSLPVAAQHTATVHIYRHGSRGNAIQVFIDGNPAFKLKDREMVTFALAPGYHEIASVYARRESKADIEALAGGEQFLQLDMEVSRSARFGFGDPANAITISLTKETNADIGSLHTRQLSAQQLDWIASLHMKGNAPADAASAVPTSLPAHGGWTFGQFTDRLTGHTISEFQIYADPDGSGRKPYITLTCDLEAGNFTYYYFTDAPVYIDAQYSNITQRYYPTRVQFRSDNSQVKTAYLTVRPDFRTININPKILQAAVLSKVLVLSFPSQTGYMITDTFSTAGFPSAKYADNCRTEEQKRK